MQERQTHAILHNIPVSVLVFSGGKLKIKNKHAERLLADISIDIGCITGSAEDHNLDY
jgi:hypothetical protein